MEKMPPEPHTNHVVTGAGQKIYLLSRADFSSDLSQTSYDKLKMIVICGMSSGAGVGNYVRPVRIERPCAETVIASSMIAQ